MKITSLTLKNVKSAIKFCLVIPFALLCRNWKRNIWIISERTTQARDNGYCFFKYLRENHPGCKAYYIIDKSAKDYKKIEQYGNIIQFDSWKHYFYYYLSKVHISSHVDGCCTSGARICRRIDGILGIKKVFIPHGVSYGISEFCLKKYAKINLFICSGKKEYDNVLENYGYDESEVAYTGFPRLDGWHDIQVNPRQIVLMPTWRLYLAQNPNMVFENTTYFQAYQEFIQDKQLSEFLIKNDVKMIFYLHNEMRKYVKSFNTECQNIEVVYQDDVYDIQDLLKTSALLITDYSSVHFDFAYMKKPVLYYQFDKEEFFEKQYLRGNFVVEEDGFGTVAYEKEELIRELKKLWEHGFQMQEKYYDRMREFYQIYDDRNCERVYQKICEI